MIPELLRLIRAALSRFEVASYYFAAHRRWSAVSVANEGSAVQVHIGFELLVSVKEGNRKDFMVT